LSKDPLLENPSEAELLSPIKKPMKVPEEVLKRVAGFVYEKKQLRLDMFIERLWQS
jgi:hypothetical protein